MTPHRRRTIFAKEFFDLQFTFAERIAGLSGISMDRALLEYTNLYVRFGLGRAFDREHELWRAYSAGLKTATDGREWTYRFYLEGGEANTAPAVRATFGCFSYAVLDSDVVRLHFHNTDPEGCSPLSASRVEHRRAELAKLFSRIRSDFPQGLVVAGVSWLYNLDAYRRLFPASYSASAQARHGLYRSMPLWGQFLDHTGHVKPTMTQAFLEAIAKRESIADLGGCFPFQVLTVEAPIQVFYEFYGV
ncbi:hypothetical protein WME76_07765 [Sorangium sp. So ce119]|uniref:hypothetical protein n=1 Tax=Sorangium sp. So ce119 TaxID=3133279 RepID=UPI003F5DA0C9